MDVYPDVTALDQERLAGMQPHPHTDGRLCDPLLGSLSASHGVARRAEDEKERVALRVDLDPVVFRRCLSNQTLMFGQGLGKAGGA